MEPCPAQGQEFREGVFNVNIDEEAGRKVALGFGAEPQKNLASNVSKTKPKPMAIYLTTFSCRYY